MLLLTHFIASAILAAILFPFFGFYSLAVFIGGFLIDFDHVLFYLAKFKSLNLKKAHHYYRNIAVKKDMEEYKKVILVFHSIEFIALMLVLSFYYKPFLALFMGAMLHMIMDMLYLYPTFKIMSIKKLSLFGQVKNAKEPNK